MVLLFQWMQITSEIIQQLIYPIVTTLTYVLPQMNKGLVSCMLNNLKHKYISSTTVHLTMENLFLINLSMEYFSNKQCNLKHIMLHYYYFVMRFFQKLICSLVVLLFFFFARAIVFDYYGVLHIGKIPNQWNNLLPRKVSAHFHFLLQCN